MEQPGTPRPAEGLLEKIAETALDDDYYVVRAGPHEQSRQFNTVLTGLVLAVFALLVAIAVIQTRSDRPATEQERTTLIDDVASRKASLAAREETAERLRTEVADLRSAVVRFDPRYEELRVVAADRAASGSGVTVRVGSDDGTGYAISDRDLQRLVNALWYAGAEAVSVNGKRIGSLSSIRVAGGIIKVNYQPVDAPFSIIALGDPDTLKDRFEQTSVGRIWDNLRDNGQVKYAITRSDELSVDSAPDGRLAIQHAKAIEEDR